MNKRRKFSNSFKTKVALEALSDRYSIQELGRKHEIHPTQIAKWKKEFLENADAVFSNGNTSSDSSKTEEMEKLYKIIGQQKVEIDFLKKALS